MPDDVTPRRAAFSFSVLATCPRVPVLFWEDIMIYMPIFWNFLNKNLIF